MLEHEICVLFDPFIMTLLFLRAIITGPRSLVKWSGTMCANCCDSRRQMSHPDGLTGLDLAFHKRHVLV